MKNPTRSARKSYALQRMAMAIERAIHAPTTRDKERAARWAAAWGQACGITPADDQWRHGAAAPDPFGRGPV